MINWWLHHRALRIAPKGSPDVDCLTWLLHSWWWILWFDDCSIWANIVFDSLTTTMNKSVNTLLFRFHSAVRIQKYLQKRNMRIYWHYKDLTPLFDQSIPRMSRLKTYFTAANEKCPEFSSSAAFQRFCHANSPECRSHSSTWTFVLMNEKSFIRLFSLHSSAEISNKKSYAWLAYQKISFNHNDSNKHSRNFSVRYASYHRAFVH